MRLASPRPGSRRATERTLGLTLATFLLLAALTAVPAAAGWWDDAVEARDATLTELRDEPARWRDVPVLLDVRFGGVGERVNPYFTQFTPERWQPVRLLPPTGDVDGGAELGTAFVARGGRDDLRLARISPNRRVKVRAVVRDEVAGEPWIEILAFTLPADPLTPEESALVREADRFLEHRNPEAAERLYRRVLDGRTLADRDRAGLLRKVGVALHDRRRPQDALAAFRDALRLDPEDLDARHRAERLEEVLARKPLPATDGDTPPVAGRAAPTTPPSPTPSDAPLLLPGNGSRLAPPTGLPTPPAKDADAAQDAPPLRKAAEPAKKDADEEEPPPEDGKEPEPAPEPEPSDDDPPPVPRRPGLSGPK